MRIDTKTIVCDVCSYSKDFQDGECYYSDFTYVYVSTKYGTTFEASLHVCDKCSPIEGAKDVRKKSISSWIVKLLGKK